MEECFLLDEDFSTLRLVGLKPLQGPEVLLAPKALPMHSACPHPGPPDGTECYWAFSAFPEQLFRHTGFTPLE